MEKYTLAKKGRRIYLAYVYDSKKEVYASVSDKYEEFVRLIAKSNEIYDIMTVMRLFVLMRVLPRVKDVIKAVDVVRDMRDFEVLFWYVKFNKASSAIKAFKTLYELR